MKMKEIIMMLSLCLFTVTGVYAQTTGDEQDDMNGTEEENVSAPSVLKSSQDFMDAYNWLMQTPVHEQDEKRQQVIASISTYLEDNPEIDIELDSKLLKFADSSPQLLSVFMGGYAAHIIKNNDDDKVAANTAGIESVIEYYTKNEQFLEKDRKVERFIKLEEKEKLDKYIERKVDRNSK